MNDPYVSCPYNPLHQVPRSRIQRHLVKCEKVYPELKICPYNATHRYPESKFKAHVAECPSKIEGMTDKTTPKVTGYIHTPKRIVQEDYLKPTDPEYEIWDD